MKNVLLFSKRLLLGVSLFLAACSSTAPRAPHYSAPSTAPVRAPIARAQTHAADARKAIAAAVAAKDDATLQLALKDAGDQVDALTFELTTAQSALTSYENKVAELTTQLNRQSDECNAALIARDKEKAIADRLAHARNRLFLLLCAAAIWIFRTPLLALLKLAAGLVTKIPV